MGVPAFFRWLSTKYPKIISSVKEDHPVEVDGEAIPIDISGPNPNGEEFDNLYLDMNGIVHPCSHPEDRPPPANEEEMMFEIFKYTERVVNMVRPRKVLMMAVDGVAPRAKMNQQRSRRFRSAQDAAEEEENKEELRKMLKASGRAPQDGEASTPKKAWDSNVITPGTPFMNTLALSLRYWVAYKLNTDPGWAKLKVIISDATVPGEGEHKIMEFVRSQRRDPEHDPNTRHVIYGLDADLIMLALATHEPHFRVLREDVFAQDSKGRPCKLCGQLGHQAEECRGDAKEKDGEFDEKQKAVAQKPFIWLHVSILREYLEIELAVPNQGFSFDLERAIDDWVFLCFFVGNDFLPHLPSLSIREEGIATLIAIWRDNLPIAGRYVTEDGHVDLKIAQLILDGLAKQEDAIFKKRREVDVKREASAKRRKMQQQGRRGSQRNLTHRDSFESNGSPAGGMTGKTNRGKKQAENYDDVITFAPGDANSRQVRDMGNELFLQRKDIFHAQVQNANDANKSAAAVIKEQLLRRKSSTVEDGTSKSAGASEENLQTPPSALGKRKADELDTDEGTPGRNTPVPSGTPQGRDNDELPPDDVRMWEEGYGDRYYEKKFGVDPKDLAFRHKVGADYVEGLCWVLLYYLQGCPSWTWYYPHHYAPFAADCVGLADLDIKFEKGIPFKAYEQLMGVLPAASNHAIPEVFRSLMSDPDSDIIDFYPVDFMVDLNGKKFKWQGVALLPFIDEKRLLDAMNTRYHLLTPDEVSRNEVGEDVLMFSGTHPMLEDVVSKFYSKKQTKDKIKLKPNLTEGLSGKIEKIESYIPYGPVNFPLESQAMPDLPEDSSLSVHYRMPKSKNIHKSQLLRGIVMPQKALDQADIDQMLHRSKNAGRSFGGAPLYDNRRGGRGGGRGGSINYANPFASHLDPKYAPQNGAPPPFPGPGMVPPPPHLAAQFPNWLPPPPPAGYAPMGMGGPSPPPLNGGGYHGHRGGGQNYGSNYGGQNQNYNQYDGYQNQDYNRGGSGYSRDDRGYGGQGRRDDRQDRGGGQRGGRGGSSQYGRGGDYYGGRR